MKTIIIIKAIFLLCFSNLYSQWYPVSMPAGNLSRVHFPSQDTGYAVNFNGKIMKTINTGENWISQISNTSSSLMGVHFTNTSTGYVCGYTGTVLKTTNGGLNWISKSISPNTSYFYSVYFKSSDLGFVVGQTNTSQGKVYKTTNGGDNWESVSIPTSEILFSITFTSQDTGWICGYSTILKTTDGGNTWFDSPTNNTGTYNTIFFFNPDCGWVTSGSNRGMLLRTTNAGQNWTPSYVTGSVNNSINMTSVHFTTSITGWAVGITNNGYGVMYKTINGGDSWILQSLPDNRFLKFVYFNSANTGFAGGGNSASIFKTSPGFSLNLSASLEGLYESNTDLMVSDTIHVYLRNSQPPFAIVDSAMGLLNQSGNCSFEFSNVTNSTPYYIVIKHRNSIETWSSVAVSFISYEINYDFTSSASQAFGENQILIGTKYCIFSGDVNQDGAVDLTDMTMIDNDVVHYASGYIPTDLDGNLSVTIEDMAIADNNSFNFIFAETPLTLNAQSEQSSSNKNNKSSKKDKINSVKETKLYNSFPNPFNPSTSIKFGLPIESFVILKVYDLTGREVATLVNEVKQAGIHSVTFNGSNLSSGVYFYKIDARNGQAGNFSEIKKMTLIK